ncbi:MAG TPA: GlxA family transcriptional regulator [Acidimicrobiales bacterium]|nr:GlxA family transcriptional regulator [Acidimicrobiales bacterium]
MQTAPPRTVVVVAFPGVQSLDVTGPVEVFAIANRPVATPRYTTALVSRAGGTIATSSGLALVADGTLADHSGPIDTLVVAGGDGTADALADAELVAWVADAARRSRRVTSVCSGAFLLAAAGVLDGRRATTHWGVCDLLARLHPRVEVDPDRIYVRDGHVWTSAGVTAGMDLALALVEDDHGGSVALDVARQLVLFTQRPGGQSQFSAQLAVRGAGQKPLREVLAYVAAHPDADLSVAALARRAAMSPRTFARAFRAEVGTTPASYVQAVRVEAARNLLSSTVLGPAAIARACGFGTVETMHRAFRRTLATTPGQYRRHFAVSA